MTVNWILGYAVVFAGVAVLLVIAGASPAGALILLGIGSVYALVGLAAKSLDRG